MHPKFISFMRLRKMNYILLLGLIALPLAVALADYEKSHRPYPVIVPARTALYVTLNQTLRVIRISRGIALRRPPRREL
jgi:hypothetical protein